MKLDLYHKHKLMKVLKHNMDQYHMKINTTKFFESSREGRIISKFCTWACNCTG